MNRIKHLICALCSGGLLALFLVLVVSAQVPTRVESTDATIRVPDDYPTIQAAINAANDGDTILVAVGDYMENLSITEGITLSGGWDAAFSTRDPGGSVIDGQGLGRVISITCAASDTVVIMDGFTIQRGDASGLGGLHLAAEDAFTAPARMDSLPRHESLTPAQIRARMSEAAARGLYPGGELAYQTMLERLERLDNLAKAARVQSGPARGDAPSQPAADCGGGVYSWNASLRLQNSTIKENRASSTGPGYGGGVFAGQAPPGGVLLVNNTVENNVGSSATDNLMTGWGGGVYVYEAPGAIVEDNQFTGNVGNEAGYLSEGVGGGLVVDHSPGAVIRRNQMERNVGGAAWEAYSALGGGAYFRQMDNGVVSQNVLRDNQAGLRGMGRGGGMYLYHSTNVLIADNTIVGNLACLYQATGDVNGGGLGVDTVSGTTITGNLIQENIAALYGWLVSYGGGFYGYGWDENTVMTNNTISGNLTSPGAYGKGGGGFLESSYDVVIADNDFANNVSGLAAGDGGGLYLRNTTGSLIQYNRFQGNLGATDGEADGGALYVSRWGPQTFDTAVDGNLFLDNQASADPNAPSNGGACTVFSDGFTFTNNVLAGNTALQADGLDLEYAARGVVINNTLVNNGETGVLVSPYNPTPITFTNNIVVSHTVGISVTEGATATVSYTLWDNNGVDIAGAGAISHTHPVTGSPAFVHPDNDDYYLKVESAARDAGDPAGVPPAPDHDADGVIRPQGLHVDIGAYEWNGRKYYLPMVFNQYQPLIGWAVGGSVGGYGTILRTINGGASWYRQGSPAEIPDTTLTEVSAVDALNAWVVGSNVILRTRDGGQSWEKQTLPLGLPAGFEFQGINALDANTVYVVGMPTVLLHTTDGATWSQMPVGADVPGNVDFQVVDAVDQSHIWAVGATMVNNNRKDPIIAFYNGIQWHLQPTDVLTDPTTAVIGVSAIDQLHAWAVGGWGMPLATTTNGGLSWQVTDHPLSAGDMNRVAAVSPTTGWTAGDYGNILYTTNAGATWHITNVPSAFLLGLTAMDAQRAWVVGPGVSGPPPGIIARTLDAIHWETLSDPSWPNLNGISFVGARR